LLEAGWSAREASMARSHLLTRLSTLVPRPVAARRFRPRPASCRCRPTSDSLRRAPGKFWPLATRASCLCACPSGRGTAPRQGSCRHPFARLYPWDDPAFQESRGNVGSRLTKETPRNKCFNLGLRGDEA